MIKLTYEKYMCEVCGIKYLNSIEAFECEAAHAKSNTTKIDTIIDELEGGAANYLEEYPHLKSFDNAVSEAVMALNEKKKRLELIEVVKDKSKKSSDDWRLYDCARRYLEECEIIE